jgi:hypothetical protein
MSGYYETITHFDQNDAVLQLKRDCCNTEDCNNLLYKLEDLEKNCHEKYKSKHSKISSKGKIEAETLCHKLDTRRKHIFNKRNVLDQFENKARTYSRRSKTRGRTRSKSRNSKKNYSRSKRTPLKLLSR